MNLNFLIMNGYGLYVWSSFIFTLFNFLILYKVTSKQLDREHFKFVKKYNALNFDQVTQANKQSSNRVFARSTVSQKI